MQALLRIGQAILASGKVDRDRLEALRLALYADGAIGRPAADFLVKLQRRVQYPNSGFEQLFYRAIKDHVLKDGTVDAEQAAWLRHNLFSDAEITDEEQEFLRELIGETDLVSREILVLLAEAMRFPQERNNSI
jgi:hypothetical protein